MKPRPTKPRPTLVALIVLTLGASVALGQPGNGSGNKVDAGPDQTVTMPAEATLDGTVADNGPPSPSEAVSDEGQPGPPDAVSHHGQLNASEALTTSWTQVSGPGAVTFADASAVDTSATFSAPGNYVLRLTANDGALAFFDELAVTVNPQDQAPTDDPPPSSEPAQQPGTEPSSTSTETSTEPAEQPGTEPSSTSTETSKEPSSTSTEPSSTSTESTEMSAETLTLSTSNPYPPPSTETDKSSFFIDCKFSHRAQVDPIVKPGPKGTLSGHLHDFFGNRSVDSDSIWASMVGSPTTCSLSADTAGYWVQSLLRPNGTPVTPRNIQFYYRNQPYRYGTTQPFPRDFRMLAMVHFPFSYWNCAGEDKDAIRHEDIPSCGSAELKMGVQFPNCWDGVRTDSGDHISHVVYPNGADAFRQTKGVCPASHPVKLPMIQIHVVYPAGESGAGYMLSDGTMHPHADFWNTWQQDKLEQLVHNCLRSSVSCGKLSN